MTREDIIRMAEQAGIEIAKNTELLWIEGAMSDLEKFAALVAAAEREACAKLCEAKRLVGREGYFCADAIRARGKIDEIENVVKDLDRGRERSIEKLMDKFAAAAMQGLIGETPEMMREIAISAYQQADAMLAERERSGK